MRAQTDMHVRTCAKHTISSNEATMSMMAGSDVNRVARDLRPTKAHSAVSVPANMTKGFEDTTCDQPQNTWERMTTHDVSLAA
jgi:hypothetical protein